MTQNSERFDKWLELYRAARARGLSKDDADEAADAELERRKKTKKNRRKRK